MNHITAYFRFEVLAEEIRTMNGFKSPNRLDCTLTYNPTGHGLLPLFQRKNGMLFFYLIPAKEIVKASSKRQATYLLGDGKQNLTSLYFEYPKLSHLAYGYCNGKERLSDGQPNPAMPYRHDALLMVCNWPQQVIEILVVKNGKPLIEKLYNLLIEGEFKEEVRQLRKLSRPYYLYKMP
ncbi:hypothetical protein GO730_26190 [Spirosoma sp. HMF3257]|uniref:Uncharacterized protein n=1 Tax=Spirosoma telluris TaxID=2183553 RepID=A0A327NQR4_9BACT|nr:hypothetical protein [Spirosoma telluris]RAI76779.1 hypothetical protein HMF3257_26120 [Spirosoma telluris]